MPTIITVWTDGDPSVGMEGNLLNIEWNAVDPFEDPEWREEYRKQLTIFWSEFLGETAHVAFGDDPQEPEEDEPDWEPEHEELPTPDELRTILAGS